MLSYSTLYFRGVTNDECRCAKSNPGPGIGEKDIIDRTAFPTNEGVLNANKKKIEMPDLNSIKNRRLLREPRSDTSSGNWYGVSQLAYT